MQARAQGTCSTSTRSAASYARTTTSRGATSTWSSPIRATPTRSRCCRSSRPALPTGRDACAWKSSRGCPRGRGSGWTRRSRLSTRSAIARPPSLGQEAPARSHPRQSARGLRLRRAPLPGESAVRNASHRAVAQGRASRALRGVRTPALRQGRGGPGHLATGAACEALSRFRRLRSLRACPSPRTTAPECHLRPPIAGARPSARASQLDACPEAATRRWRPQRPKL